MIKKGLLILVACSLMATSALAIPTIRFASTSGDWIYTGTSVGGNVSGTFTFPQDILVIKVLGGTSDPLVNAGYVYIPDLTLTGTVGGPYTLTPIDANITIQNSGTSPTETFLTGTLGIGDLVPSGSAAGAYTVIQIDITGITSPSNTIGSPVVDAVASHGEADFNLSLQADFDIGDLIDQGGTDGDGFSGSITIPEPGAILLGGIGVCLVGWLRRRGTL